MQLAQVRRLPKHPHQHRKRQRAIDQLQPDQPTGQRRPPVLHRHDRAVLQLCVPRRTEQILRLVPTIHPDVLRKGQLEAFRQARRKVHDVTPAHARQPNSGQRGGVQI
uniref:(northern house mosquito) hypothetical protein n=1 Tax=Culex pipiens TaxID=7175 RepID=A0A8D8GZ13_CULPI